MTFDPWRLMNAPLTPHAAFCVLLKYTNRFCGKGNPIIKSERWSLAAAWYYKVIINGGEINNDAIIPPFNEIHLVWKEMHLKISTQCRSFCSACVKQAANKRLKTCRFLNKRRGRVIHYDDVMTGAMASQITSLTIVYSTVYSDADQRKHQSSASLAIVRGIHRGPVNSPHKWPVTRKMFPFDDVIMSLYTIRNLAFVCPTCCSYPALERDGRIIFLMFMPYFSSVIVTQNVTSR